MIVPTELQQEPQPEPRDLSPHVVSLARVIDRLPPGEYVIRLAKAPRPYEWRTMILVETAVRELWR